MAKYKCTSRGFCPPSVYIHQEEVVVLTNYICHTSTRLRSLENEVPSSELSKVVVVHRVRGGVVSCATRGP